jgi:hypothetical protein
VNAFRYSRPLRRSYFDISINQRRLEWEENKALRLATSQGGKKECIKKKKWMQRMWEPARARKGNWESLE